MTDGALSWLAMEAARALAGGAPPRAARLELAGGLICYRPYRCADGWVAFGALEPKFWRAWCEGVGRPELADHQFDAVGSDTHREVEAVFAERTRAEWEAFNDEHDCCLEPVLGLDEALGPSSSARARWWWSRPAGAGPSGCSGRRSSSRARRPTGRAGGPALGDDTDAVLAEAGYGAGEIAALRETGGVGGHEEGGGGLLRAARRWPLRLDAAHARPVGSGVSSTPARGRAARA